MFKNLKEKLATQVTKTNQTLLVGISSSESTSVSKDVNNRTSSITSRDDNHENHRSRIDSAASDISQYSVGQSPNTSMTYVSPPRHHVPPSDIESEYGGDDGDYESNAKLMKLQKLLGVYKNKFKQLKDAYNEVEHEKEHIKNVLQQQQDKSLTRIAELREQIKLDREAKAQLECLHKKEMRAKENRIEELTLQVNAQKDLIQLPHQTDHEEIQNLREKNLKLETLLNRCKDAIKINQEKQNELTKHRDELISQLNEKQNVIESLIKERHPDEASITSMEVQEHFDSDISVLLQDKQRLQEEIEALKIHVRQVEHELELSKQQTNEDSHKELTEPSNSNHLQEIIQNIETILPNSQSTNLFERIQQLIDEKEQLFKTNETLQNELSTNNVQFNQTVENQRQEHSTEIEKLLKEKEDEYRKTLETPSAQVSNHL
ncbi:hypothetical protein I4U23_028734 [Adineta vaga]|nr:hypothetical protein I4U23_028734 [Adineta vaga]